MKTSPKKKPQKRRSKKPSPAQPLHFLIVEDDPSHAELIRRGLLSFEKPYRLTVTTTLAGARDQIATDPPALIILDLLLPDGNGEAFLPENPQEIRFPVIVMTSHGDDELAARLLEKGAIDYLVKGKAAFDDLPHIVERALKEWDNNKNLMIANRTIQESEKRLADIISFLPDATLAIDTNGTVIAWNHAIEAMTGVPAEQMIGKANYEYALPFYHERRPMTIDLVLHDDPAVKAKYPVMKREGSTLFSEIFIPHLNKGRGAHLWFTASVLYDPDGNITGAIESIRDITGFKLAEITLRESEERYRTLIEEIPDFIIVHRQGELLYISPSISKIFGGSAKNLLHTSIFDYIVPESRETVIQAMKMRHDGGSITPYIAKLRIPDGSVRVVEIRGAIIMFEGAPAILNVLTDVTEKKWAEDAIFESEQKFRTLADYTFDWEYWIGPDGEFIYISPTCKRISGYTADEFYHNKDLMDQIVLPEDRELVREHASHVNGCQDPEDTEFRIITKKGTTVWIGHIERPVFDPEGNYLGRRGSNRDISKRKLAEESLQKKNKDLEAAYERILINEEETRHNYDLLVASQEALQKSQQLLNEIQHITKSGGWEYDVATHQAIWTDEVFRIYGVSKNYDPSNLNQDIQFYSPDDRVKIAQAFQGVIEQGIPYDLELQMDTARGKRIWVHTSGKAERTGDKIVRVFGNIMDITERKHAEEAFRESEKRFRMLIQNASDLIRIIDRDRKIAYESPSSERILGYPPGTLIGTDPSDYVHPDDLKRVTEDFQQVIDRKNTGIPTEFRIRKADGTYIWVDAIGVNLLGVPGIDGIVITTRPIEQRKKMEQVLQDSEERYRNVVEDQTEFISRFRPDGTHVFVNEAYCRYFDLKREDIIGKKFVPKIPVEDLSAITKHFASLTKTHPIGEIRHRIIMPDGQVRWQRWSDRAIFAPDGNIVEYQSVGRDISDIVKSGEALHDNEERYRDLFNRSPVGIVLTDTAGNIRELNNFMLGIFGYTREDIRSINISVFYAQPDTRRTVVETLLNQGIITDYEALFRRHDGSTFTGILNSSRILRHGETLFQSSLLDITDRKMMEEEIRTLNSALEQRVAQRTKELDVSLKEKVVLLREIHHRVKNNLQVIISILRLQKRHITDLQIQSVLQDSESRVRSMALVHEKLYRSADLAHIDIGDYLKTLANYLFSTYSVNQKQVTFRVTLTDIELDINRAIPIGLILNELISNALKHAFPEGRSGSVAMTGGYEGEDIVLSLQDDGIGLPVGCDWRHSPSLGMHLVMTLIEQVHGTIDIAASEKGVHFIIRIPRDHGTVTK